MTKMINKELVRQTLTKLLELEIGSSMPHKSGVCLELGIASLCQHPETMDGLTPTQIVHKAEETPEYEWCYEECFILTNTSIIDDDLGYMTKRRHEFVLYLLGKLDNDH